DRRSCRLAGGTHGAGDVPGVASLQQPGDRPRLPVAHGATVHPDHREDLRRRRREEHLARPAEPGARGPPLAHPEPAPPPHPPPPLRRPGGSRMPRVPPARMPAERGGVTTASRSQMNTLALVASVTWPVPVT